MICLGPIAHISVLLFFFFSGFVIFSSLEKRFKSGEKTILVFYKYFQSRFIRIYPPLIGVFLILLVFKIYIKSQYASLPDEFMFSLQDILNYTLMLEVSLGKINAPLWTLILEWWLYILGFLIYCILAIKKSLKIYFVIILLCLTSIITLKINDHFLIYFLIWTLGALFYHTKAIRFSKILFLISLSCFTYTFFYKNYLFNGVDISNRPSIQILVIFSFIGILFIFKRNKILSYISSFSYSMYIIHYPFFIFIKLNWFKSGTNHWYELILIDLLVILISFFFSKIFENKEWFLSIIYKIKIKYLSSL